MKTLTLLLLSTVALAAESPLLDPGMKGCQHSSCAFHGKYKKLVPQPGAKTGDVVKCPISGALFRVTKDSPKITHEGKSYFTCCEACAQSFKDKHKNGES